MLKKNLQMLAVLLSISGFAQADSYESSLIAVGDVHAATESSSEPMSCREARATAWFLRELSRSDGDTNPELAYVPCGREILAESTADID